MKKKCVYVLGNDGFGWSVDKDRENIIRSLILNGVDVTKNIFRAKYIYCVWWDLLDNWKYKVLLRNKKICAVLTNCPSSKMKTFLKIKDRINIWIYANNKQRDFLKKNGIDDSCLVYNPFYVKESCFKKIDSKNELFKKYKIDKSKLNNKFIISTFQRDSLGSDLNKSKWQKNPELAIDIFNSLKKDFVVLLAGPRRHFIKKQLTKLGIEFIYIGREVDGDDIRINNLESSIINDLYNISDISIVTSSSEGGPKAIIESVLTGTPVVSTDVGFAKEFLDLDFICETKEEFVTRIKSIINGNHKESFTKTMERTKSINNRIDYEKRVISALDKLCQM